MFTLHTTDVIRIAHSFGINIHCYADDMQLHVYCRPEEFTASVRRMLCCIAAIDKLLSSNRLKINPDKTKFLGLSSRQRFVTVNITPLHCMMTPSLCHRLVFINMVYSSF